MTRTRSTKTMMMFEGKWNAGRGEKRREHWRGEKGERGSEVRGSEVRHAHTHPLSTNSEGKMTIPNGEKEGCEGRHEGK